MEDLLLSSLCTFLCAGDLFAECIVTTTHNIKEWINSSGSVAERIVLLLPPIAVD